MKVSGPKNMKMAEKGEDARSLVCVCVCVKKQHVKVGDSERKKNKRYHRDICSWPTKSAK